VLCRLKLETGGHLSRSWPLSREWEKWIRRFKPGADETPSSRRRLDIIPYSLCKSLKIERRHAKIGQRIMERDFFAYVQIVRSTATFAQYYATSICWCSDRFAVN
jgi:hypothetical protein